MVILKFGVVVVYVEYVLLLVEIVGWFNAYY